MTKQERLKAFEMRLDGSSWSKIGSELGYSASTVYQDIVGCVRSKPRQVTCIYPAIRYAITERYGGSVSAFAAACGIPRGTMYSILSGRCFVPPERMDAISDKIGLPSADAFAREDD